MVSNTNDPFEHMTPDDFLQAIQPGNWRELQRLHTPTLEAILEEGRLTLLFPDGEHRQFERSDVEALTRFLDQYANVQPLPAPDESVLQDWQPTRVEESEGLSERYTTEEIRHARELMETGGTEITDLVQRYLENEGQQAIRDWHTRAIVRVRETTVKHSVDSWGERTFRQGEELEMVQWGRAGRPVERDSWWTSYDIDSAFLIGSAKVEVVKVIEEVSPV
jgi:hypothetical protein